MERRTSSPPSVVSTVSATEKSSPEVNHIEMNHRVKGAIHGKPVSRAALGGSFGRALYLSGQNTTLGTVVCKLHTHP